MEINEIKQLIREYAFKMDKFFPLKPSSDNPRPGFSLSIELLRKIETLTTDQLLRLGNEGFIIMQVTHVTTIINICVEFEKGCPKNKTALDLGAASMSRLFSLVHEYCKLIKQETSMDTRVMDQHE